MVCVLPEELLWLSLFLNTLHGCLIGGTLPESPSFLGSVVLLICLVPTVLCVEEERPFTFSISLECHWLKISALTTFDTFIPKILLILPALTTS